MKISTIIPCLKNLKLKSVLLFIFGLLNATTHAQQSIPYCDNFNGATLWTVTALLGTPWQQGSPSYGATNSSHTPPSCFDVALSTAYASGTITYLNSPAINFTNAPNSRLSFWQNRNTEAGQDGTYMEYSYDNGVTWFVLGTAGDPNATNWYNNPLVQYTQLPGWDGNSGGWVKSTYNLDFLTGTPSVLFRFVFISNSFNELDGFSIDDFCITAPPGTDIGVNAMVSPQGIVAVGVPLPVQVRVKNYGSLSVANFNVYYKLDNGAAVGPTNYSSSLAPGSDVLINCPNITVPAGTHLLSAYAVIANDGDHYNDTLKSTVSAFATVTPPYFDNFDGANTGWIASATNPTTVWELGTPAYGATSGSYSAPNSWDINLNTGYQSSAESYLTSPLFDFTNVVNARLKFFANYNVEANWDGVRCEYKTSVSSWYLLGAVGSPGSTNWYNYGNLNSSSMPGWSDNSNGWKQIEYTDLAMLAGASDVQFRFVFTSDPAVNTDGFSLDNFQIIIPSNTDIGADLIVAPAGGVASGVSVPVKVRVFNYGQLAANNFNVFYKIDNGAAVGPTNYSGSIAPNSSIIITCPNLIIPAGSHTIKAYAVVANDGDHLNDTVTGSFNGINNQALSYYDNFDGANVGWVATTNDPITAWELGTPNFGATSSSYSAPNSWDINLNTAYGASALAYLTSPFFDFTTAPNAKLKFFTNYNTETNWDGVRCEYRAIDTTWHVLGNIGSPGSVNWYTNTIISSGNLPAWAGNSLGWQQCEYDSLNMLNGAADVQFRFVFTSDISVVVDGFSLDNFEIKLPEPIDVGVKLIVSPTATVSAGATLPVEVLITNYGYLPVSNFNVFFKLDNNAAVGPVNYGGTINPTQSSQISIGNVTIPAGTHTLIAYTSLATDGDHNNDTTKMRVVGVSTVTLPYFDNFDGTDAGWYTDAVNPSTQWQKGSPTYGTTNSSYSAPNCWDINLNSPYQSSAVSTLTSPYIDFTNAIDAKLKFFINYNTEPNLDGVRCEYRANDTTWHLLGNMGAIGSTNWYNYSFISSSSMPAWSSASMGWIPCEFDSLNMLTGANDVQFRFVFTSDLTINTDGFSIDNFEVDIPLPNSASTQGIKSQNVLITPSPQYYQTLIVNKGSAPLNTVTVGLRVDNTTVLTETATLNPPLNYNESRWYTFINPWNATAGFHTVCTYTSNPNGTADINNYDDTTCFTYTVLDSASVFPYCNGFENPPVWPVFNPQTWAADYLWQIGSPTKSVLNSSHTGSKCWATDLNFPYGNNKSSALISPVFYLQQGHCYKLSFWHMFQTEYLKDGGTVEFSTDNGFSWTVLGWAGDPDWFNTNAVAAFGTIPISGWSGLQNTWSFAQHDIYSANGGEYIFRFRFGSNANNNSYDGWAIDDLCFDEIASPCFAGIGDNTANGFSLSQNNPNPANDIATIHFTIPSSKKATLRIVDVLGNVLITQNVEGTSTVVDVKQLRGGIYYYELQFESQRLVKKMVVVR